MTSATQNIFTGQSPKDPTEVEGHLKTKHYRHVYLIYQNVQFYVRYALDITQSKSVTGTAVFRNEIVWYITNGN